jgi:hypothetical protein
LLPSYEEVKVTGGFKIKSAPDAVTLGSPTLTEHLLLLSVSAVPGGAGEEDPDVPAVVGLEQLVRGPRE